MTTNPSDYSLDDVNGLQSSCVRLCIWWLLCRVYPSHPASPLKSWKNIIWNRRKQKNCVQIESRQNGFVICPTSPRSVFLLLIETQRLGVEYMRAKKRRGTPARHEIVELSRLFLHGFAMVSIPFVASSLARIIFKSNDSRQLTFCCWFYFGPPFWRFFSLSLSSSRSHRNSWADSLFHHTIRRNSNRQLPPFCVLNSLRRLTSALWTFESLLKICLLRINLSPDRIIIRSQREHFFFLLFCRRSGFKLN